MTPEGQNLRQQEASPAEKLRIADETAMEHLDSAFELLDATATQLRSEFPGLAGDISEALEHIDEATNYLEKRFGLLPLEPTDEESLRSADDMTAEELDEEPSTDTPDGELSKAHFPELWGQYVYIQAAWDWLPAARESRDLEGIKDTLKGLIIIQQTHPERSSGLQGLVAQYQTAVTEIEQED